jgi:hypothetical protein
MRVLLIFAVAIGAPPLPCHERAGSWHVTMPRGPALRRQSLLYQVARCYHGRGPGNSESKRSWVSLAITQRQQALVRGPVDTWTPGT